MNQRSHWILDLNRKYTSLLLVCALVLFAALNILSFSIKLEKLLFFE